METFYLTDTGIVRDHNEDSVIIIKNDFHLSTAENHWMNLHLASIFGQIGCKETPNF